ncbi:MAG: hypothetical protein ABH821_04175 [archaeon]
MEERHDYLVLTLDLHNHLNEKKMNSLEFWKKVKQRKIDVIASTEHSCYNPKEAFEKLLKTKPKDKILIPGIELDTSIGHVLAYGFDDSIFDFQEFFGEKVDFKKVLKTAKENNIILSIAHPWGFSYDSAAYILGAEKLRQLIRKEDIGVETYTGIIGYLSYFVYESKWIKKPLSLFEFLERNRLTRYTGLSRIGKKLKKKLESKQTEVSMRCASAIELGKEAKFNTAGSDTHTLNRIGTGVLKIKFPKNLHLNNKNVLTELKKKKIIWSGPLHKQSSTGTYYKPSYALTKKELFEGVKYAAKIVAKRSKTTQRIVRKLKRTKVKK